MKRIIIFDFNRTIYNPDLKILMPRAKFVLSTLLRRKFTLYLMSRAEKSRRLLIENFGLNQYFARIIVTRTKSKKDFEKLISQKDINSNQSFVIGDRARKEITIGNKLGLQTIWVRSGKFANEAPREGSEYPTYIVNTLSGILQIIN